MPQKSFKRQAKDSKYAPRVCCRRLPESFIFFFIPAAVIFFVAVVSSTLLLRRSPISSFSVSRYSRGGKEKKAAKRNTSESSRCCPAVAAAPPPPPPSFFLTLSSHIFRDVSDFDPRKNRQPAPGSTPHVLARAAARGAYAAGACLLPAYEALKRFVLFCAWQLSLTMCKSLGRDVSTVGSSSMTRMLLSQVWQEKRAVSARAGAAGAAGAVGGDGCGRHSCANTRGRWQGEKCGYLRMMRKMKINMFQYRVSA